jgi:signal transduction histidine kinase
LISNGVHLVESAQHSTYGRMYNIEPLELEYALKEVRRHVHDGSDDFLQEFEGNTAVETILRRRFQDDFRAMRTEREELQDQADEALFDPNADTGTQETVRDAMVALGNMEKDWYRQKLKVILAQRHLLENLPPLAADLAVD